MNLGITKLCVVVPIFNEIENLDNLFEDLHFLKENYLQKGIVCSFLLIDDCSSDGSFQKLKEITLGLGSYDIKIESNEINLGFARTITKGFSLAEKYADYFMILPGDAEVDVRTLSAFSFEKDVDLIFFERKNISTRPIPRIVISYLYRIIISLIFIKKIEDYNGIFIISKKFKDQVDFISNSFFICAEVIIKARILKKNILKGYFDLRKKNIYKSTSLNWNQLKKVINDLFGLFVYRYSK